MRQSLKCFLRSCVSVKNNNRKEKVRMKKIQILKKCIFLFCLIIILMVVISVMVKYEVEGEKKLPYSLSKIFVISTVEGTPIDDGQNIWNINVKQANDLYFYIDKNEVTEETIKQITIENFSITQVPQKGEVAIYRPTGELEKLYTYSEQNYLNESLTYTGAAIDDLKTLEIANTGGVIGCRVALDNLGTYISNDSTEITYNGALLQNIGVNLEEIKMELCFDILIETNKNVTYKGAITVQLPGEELIEKGAANFEMSDFEEVVFKRL